MMLSVKRNDGRKVAGLRLPVAAMEALQESAALAGFTQQQIVEDALLYWFGREDTYAAKRREMLLDAVKQGAVKRPFERPLAPSRSNALTSRGDSATVPPSRSRGVVAQLVEHHNGIIAKDHFKKSSPKLALRQEDG
jgi:hypothetical protein